MIRKVVLENFKAFEKFTVWLKGDTMLVGPNNAGKSTLIAAIRAGANMVRIAARSRATAELDFEDGRAPAGHWFDAEQVGLVEENLRHEFHQVDTSLKIDFSDDARLEAVWPVDERGKGFFYLRHRDVNLREPLRVRRAFPRIGLVPVLAPLEHRERILGDEHVRSNRDGRLASRHFRNQLYALQRRPSGQRNNGLEDFK